MDNKELIKKSKPPYLLGLLCLIPLIGAFVGLGLLLYGIIRYKDKWLIIIGASGIVFTIAIYSFLFYNMKNGELSKKGFARISQTELNELVEKIEFLNCKTDSIRIAYNNFCLLMNLHLFMILFKQFSTGEIQCTITKGLVKNILYFLPGKMGFQTAGMIYIPAY